MLDIKKLLTKVMQKISSMNGDIVYYDRVITTSFTAGTIGTRGAQVSFDNPAPQSYYIRSMCITNINDSSSYLPIVFFSSGKFFVNFYRCKSSAESNASCTIRIVYTKSIWGGTA